MELEKITWEIGHVNLPCVLCRGRVPSEFIATVFLPNVTNTLPTKAALCRKCANLHEGTVMRMLMGKKKFSGKK